MKNKKNTGFRLFTGLIMLSLLTFLIATVSSCGIYKFNEATYPDSIKTIYVKFIENKARYQNNQLGPKLTDKLRQKIIGQTRLTQINNENADWVIDAFVTDYSFSTSAISNQQVASNQLTVAVHVTLNRRKEDEVEDYDVSRSFEFKGNLSFQQAETALLDEITRTLTDEIFNKIFSKW